MKYAIKFQGLYWTDGLGGSVYESMGWQHAKPTMWDDRDTAEAILRYWFNNNDHKDYVDGFEKDGVTPRPATQFRYATRGGMAVGQYLRKIDDQTKKAYLVENPGPFPEVVEVKDDFGMPAWSSVA